MISLVSLSHLTGVDIYPTKKGGAHVAMHEKYKNELAWFHRCDEEAPADRRKWLEERQPSSKTRRKIENENAYGEIPSDERYRLENVADQHSETGNDHAETDPRTPPMAVRPHG